MLSPSLSPEKRLYAPLTPSPLNPNTYHHYHHHAPDSQPKNQTTTQIRYSSSNRRSRSKPKLHLPKNYHLYNASPTEQLLRQKAAAAWRSATLRSEVLLISVVPPYNDEDPDGDKEEEDWKSRTTTAPPAPPPTPVGRDEKANPGPKPCSGLGLEPPEWKCNDDYWAVVDLNTVPLLDWEVDEVESKNEDEDGDIGLTRSKRREAERENLLRRQKSAEFGFGGGGGDDLGVEGGIERGSVSGTRRSPMRLPVAVFVPAYSRFRRADMTVRRAFVVLGLLFGLWLVHDLVREFGGRGEAGGGGNGGDLMK